MSEQSYIETTMPQATHHSPAETANRPATDAKINDMAVMLKASAPLDQNFPTSTNMPGNILRTLSST